MRCYNLWNYLFPKKEKNKTKTKHYVIGDVHGHYQTLLALVDKLPSNAKLIFVGDLIDRGSESKEVVKFVREGNHLCVMGNHEEMLIEIFPDIVNAYEENIDFKYYLNIFNKGLLNTYLSYGVIKLVEGKPHKVDNFKKALELLNDDLDWMKKLPICLELDTKHRSQKPVVVSHASLGEFWKFRNVLSQKEAFKTNALWNRKNPSSFIPIFNIFGHTTVAYGVEVKPHYVNVDTGCFSSSLGYGRLSAYCVETEEVVFVSSC